MPRKSELIAFGLGCIGTVLLFIAAISTESGDIRGAGSMAMALFHFFVVMIALPFLITAVYKTDSIPRWFRNSIGFMSLLNAIFMLLTSAAISGDKSRFVFFAILELLPVLFFYLQRDLIAPKQVKITV